ncbi:MAG: hypothetical protein A2W93_15770 [Bacteroidetes bacterium GWF2_43_63]|nr:MAG: hypothetical protein A2W94_13620 [Bacteroidetes bacterium GWE2_42_42]OFY53126.1 MAG: hypothetical protein A2W93_15770 [Bacteroidetes bacterium GWF2_43_63]
MEGTFNEGKGIVAFSDSTYILLGNRQTIGGQSSAWLFKVDSAGTILWEKYFLNYTLSSAENLARHDDTSVVITGTALQGTDYSAFAARVSLSGNLLWEKTFGTNVWDAGYCSVSDNDGNVWVTGLSMGYDTLGQDVMLYKLNGSTGDSIQYRRIDCGFNDKGVYLDTASNNNILLATHSYSAAADSNMSRIWRFDYNMDTVWTWAPVIDSADFLINCLFEDIYQRIVYSGDMKPDTGSVYRLWYGFLSSAGSFMWELFQPPYYLKNIRRGIIDSSNNYYFTGGIFPYYFGFGNSDVGFWRDSAGWVNYRYFGALQDEEGMDLDFAADGGLAFIGTTKSFGPGVNNIFLVKISADGTFNDADYIHYTPALSAESVDAKLYPNPCRGSFRIEIPDEYECRIDIFNLQGMHVVSDRYQSGETYTLRGLNNGVYLIKVTSEHQSYNFRLLLQQD